MLNPRIITSLLIDSNQNLVKTINFDNRKYIGDPFNAAYIFSNYEVDELLILDIDASRFDKTISYDFVESLTNFTNIPLTIGGGIKDIEQIQKILSLGVERIVLSNYLNNNLNFLLDASNQFGSSTISVAVNIVKINNDKYYGYFGTPNKFKKPYPLIELVKMVEDSGAGELIINNVDNDGLMNGIDISLLEKVHKSVNIPVVGLGGCGSENHIKELFNKVNISGIACGSFFIYASDTREVLLKYIGINQLL